MLRFFDADLGIGNSGLGLPNTTGPADALALMNRYQIQSALVYDRHAHEAGIFHDFEPLLAYCRPSPPLLPAIPLLPPACGEQPSPDELIALSLAHDIKAVRVSPHAHRFSFNPRDFCALLEPLQHHRIPLILNSMNIQDHPWEHVPPWNDLRDVATAFPQLPIILVYTGMLQGRRLIPLLAQCPNVLADLTCVSYQFIEFIVERFGPNRLVLASHYPSEDPGLYTPAILYADLNDSARRNLAHDNLQRLVEAIR